MTHAGRVWFITGAGRGFGGCFARAALLRGDLVAATARNAESLGPLVAEFGDRVLPLGLDLGRRAGVVRAVDRTVDHFGTLDVVVNNAGYGLAGAIEEVTEADTRELFDVNFFGSLWTIQAALPTMRSKSSGHIIQVSSMGGLTAFPTLGMYHATKWAVEGMAEALRAEVGPLGINVTILEPGSHDTGARAGILPSPKLSAYAALRQSTVDARPARPPGDPDRAAAALLAIVDDAKPPLRLLLGADAVALARRVLQERVDEYRQWEELARSTAWDPKEVEDR